jgi:hypothetical protein
MTIATPWHVASYDRFLNQLLPRLLAERLPLSSYRVIPEGDQSARLNLTIAGRVELVFTLPRPDEHGIFTLDGRQIVVFPLASTEKLDTATVRCVGEQLSDLIAERLGQAPAHLEWDEQIARSWLPLERWVHEFLLPQPDDYGALHSTAQELDRTNWLATATHLRRIVVPQPATLFDAGQVGRVCPIEVPEGPNIGRIFTIARGATIDNDRLVVVDEQPTATLGLSAAAIPLLEHDEYARLLMGANMMRQWLPPPDPEPAFVQTGEEPEHPAFWCGRNLLTAFITWDADTFEDGVVISAGAARRLGYPAHAEPGDKLSNRHGTKSVVSRVVPDDAMPHLADGTPVEVIYSFCGLPSRLNFGQVREAVLGRVARAEGRPQIVPPFGAPTADEIRARLRRAGLPESGMEVLTLGSDGPPLAQPSTVGWVYWGKLVHTAASKLRAFTGDEGMPRLLDEFDQPERVLAWPAWTPEGQRQGELEYYALRQAGAHETIREQYNTRSAARPDAATLAARLAAGPVEQSGAPSPLLAALQRRLEAAGVRAALAADGLAFSFAPPQAPVALAQPVPHPWLQEHKLAVVGTVPELSEYAALEAANQRLASLLAGGGPEMLVRRAYSQLEAAVAAMFDALLRPEHLTFDQPAIFSARAVAAPGGTGVRYDQVGLAEDLAWALFGPLLGREIGAEAAQRRDEAATAVLDDIMARSWVLIGRAPTLEPQGFLAFHPVRIPDRVVRLSTLACDLLNTDYDGDQVAVFLPVTEAGQREAGEKLSVAAHLTRDPALVAEIRPRMDSLLGLAHLSLTEAGRERIEQVAGVPIAVPDGYLTRWTLAEALESVAARSGPVAALEASERLAALGFEVSTRLGLSLSPFVGEGWGPARPASDEPGVWERYLGEVDARLDAERNLTGDFGGLLLAAKIGARGNRRLVTMLIATRYQIPSLYNSVAPATGNMRDGLTLAEMLDITSSTRIGIDEINRYWETGARALRERFISHGYGVLARAMRSARPGPVFALAAQANETDPLHDIDARLFAGLGAT